MIQVGYFDPSPFGGSLLFPYYSKSDENQSYASIIDKNSFITDFVPIDLEIFNTKNLHSERVKWSRIARLGDIVHIGVAYRDKFVCGKPQVVLSNITRMNHLHLLPTFAKAELYALAEGRSNAYQHRLRAIERMTLQSHQSTAKILEKKWHSAPNLHDTSKSLTSNKINLIEQNTDDSPSAVQSGYTVISSSTFNGVRHIIDGINHFNCSFTRSVLIYRGGYFSFVNCRFFECRVILEASISQAGAFIKWGSDPSVGMSKAIELAVAEKASQT